MCVEASSTTKKIKLPQQDDDDDEEGEEEEDQVSREHLVVIQLPLYILQLLLVLPDSLIKSCPRGTAAGGVKSTVGKKPPVSFV